VVDHDEDECCPAEVAPAVPKRRRGETPLVIVSAARNAQAHVTRFTDGSTSQFGPYGS
jgi:hypothetical protein